MHINEITNRAVAIVQPVGSTCAGVATAVAMVVLTPVVCLVALPIFAIKAAIVAIESKILYNKTLTNHTRAPYGRTAEQNYTRWDGKETENELIKNGKFCHGCPNGEPTVIDEGCDTTFKSKEDAEWLETEYARKVKEEDLKETIDMMIIIATGIIPILGVYTSLGYLIVKGKYETPKSDWQNKESWNWRAAIHFHEANLEKKLLLSQ